MFEVLSSSFGKALGARSRVIRGDGYGSGGSGSVL